jgi:SAM-dependent methyltransferase
VHKNKIFNKKQSYIIETKADDMIRQAGDLLRRLLPPSLRRKAAQAAIWPPIGGVRFGHFRTTKPIGTDFGSDRGLEIDRYYIEKFLFEHTTDIRGHVLEVKDNAYTVKHGGDRVMKSDVLHKIEGNSQATIIADLTNADHIPSNTFDAIIFTQTLQFIYDIHAAAATLYRILKPGGVLLATVSGIAQISRYDYDMWGDYWRFTSLSAQSLFEEFFPGEAVTVRTYGNVLTATSFLAGLACQDLRIDELDAWDPDYEVLIAIRAVKPAG